MGLAASQARLLTITSRKSRAQFESMRLSHQKLALSRNLTEISNQYQNSLDKTKLYYDFYGVNSTETPLTYNMLLSPSSINDYTPTLISNNQGQIVLSTPYAEAARAAGIPQEGLGCTPSSIMRDAFIMALAEQNIITQATANAITAVSYNPNAGLGGDNLINTIVETGTYEDLLDRLSGGGNTDGVTLEGLLLDLNGFNADKLPTVLVGTRDGSYSKVSGGGTWSHNVGDSGIGLDGITFADLISGDKEVLLMIEGNEDKANNWQAHYAALTNSVRNIYTTMGNALISILGDDCNAVDAVAYANDQMQTMCWEPSSTPPTGKSDGWWDFQGLFGDEIIEYEANWYTRSIPSGNGLSSKEDKAWDKAVNDADSYMALINCYRSRSVVWPWDAHENVGAIDVTNFAKAWFTYFMQYMAGLGTPEANQWYINWRDKVDNQSFADADSIGDYEFTFSTTYVSDNEALVSNFYDTLFNQICLNGWTENNQVATDSNYLKEMLQSGMMYITSMADDYHYYQNNYSTNTFIKEVSDDAAIAAAESKYATEKARINAKEQELDLKMKNLDTEISSLETEYEAVKKVIEGNVSKSFTRYDS